MQRCDAGTMLHGDSMSLEEPASESGSLPQMGLREILFFFFFSVGSVEEGCCAPTWAIHYWKSRGQLLPCHCRAAAISSLPVGSFCVA